MMLDFLRRKWSQLISLALIVCFAVVTLAALLDSNHALKNLEPYPDGLLYSLSARNFILGKGLQLVYSDSQLPLWVPSLYPLVLSSGYIVSSQPHFFYLVNVGLAILTMMLVGQIAYHFTQQKLSAVVAIGAYLSCAYVWWLPSVPMTENLILLLAVLQWYGIISKKSWAVWLVLFSSVALLWSRLALVGMAVVGLGWVLYQVWRNNKNQQLRSGLLIGCSILAIGSLTVLASTPVKETIETFVQSFMSSSEYYQFGYIGRNTVSYVRILLGAASNFLWQTTPLLSLGLVLPAVAGWIFIYRRLLYSPEVMTVVISWLSIFPILLIFYVVDARYIVLTLPIVAIGFGLVVTSLLNRGHWKWLAILMLCFCWQMFTQRTLFREVVVSSLLGRSTAWQYEAIENFNRFAQDKSDIEIITALPPFLVDAYQDGEYRVLPLSQYQEFIYKDDWVWGSPQPLAMHDISKAYEQDVLAGKRLYISNAYITHNQKVIDDFEYFKQSFTLELLQSGCEEACNIYLITPLTYDEERSKE